MESLENVHIFFFESVSFSLRKKNTEDIQWFMYDGYIEILKMAKKKKQLKWINAQQ